MPQARQIPGESENFSLLLGGGDASLLTLKLRGLFLEVVQLKQRVIPAPLQCARHQTLGRVDFLIAPLGECSFVLGTFNPHLPLTQNGLIPRLQLRKSRQSELEFGLLQGFQYFFRDGGIEPITTETHAVLAGQTFAA
jgi:hypothetical protein